MSTLNNSSIETQRQQRIDKLKMIENFGFQPFAVESHRDFQLATLKYFFNLVHSIELRELVKQIEPLSIEYFLYNTIFPKDLVDQVQEQLQLRETLKALGLDPEDERFKTNRLQDLMSETREYMKDLLSLSTDRKLKLLSKFLIIRISNNSQNRTIEFAFSPNQEVTIAGRVKSKRVSGKIAFATLEDESCPEGFQLILKHDLLQEKQVFYLTPDNTHSDVLQAIIDGRKRIETLRKSSSTLSHSQVGDVIIVKTRGEEHYFRIRNKVEYSSLIDAYTNQVDFHEVLPNLKKKYTIQDIRTEYLNYVSKDYLQALETEGLTVYYLEKTQKTMTFDHYRDLIDVGDYIQATGKLEYSKTNEPSIMVSRFHILTKSLRPLPEKIESKNLEYRFIHRVADFKYNTVDECGVPIREIIAKKSRFWQIWREELLANNFLEVETPVFEHTPGGAEAKPFTTHYDELDQDVYLRISLELPLKQLIAGGFEKVFEIGKIFRNEGASPQHLQEYTQMEFYWAYADYRDCMNFVQRVYRKQIQEITGSLVTKDLNDKEIHWGSWQEQTSKDYLLRNGWPEIPFYKAIEMYSKDSIDISKMNEKELRTILKDYSIEFDKSASKARLIDLVWKKLARVNVIDPIFVVLPPVELEPLAKRDPQFPHLTQRFQVVAGGAELGKGFSELNDPLDQLQRFEDQQAARDAGDAEAQFMNRKYVEALEYGLPPLTGFGISERFFSFILGKPIKETVTFPIIRNESN